MDHRADVRPRGVDRQVDGQVRRRADGRVRGRGLAIGVSEPDDDEVVGVELVLAQAGSA